MLNEFRQDLVSGQWVLFATGRGHSLRKSENGDGESYQSKESCPFEDMENSGKHDIIWRYPDTDNWHAMIIKNKFPAVKTGLCIPEKDHGPFKIADAVGSHEVVVYKGHDRSIYDFTQDDFENTVKIYKKRYAELIKENNCAKYVLMFHNHGKEAGASLFHSHSQIITLPILPSDVFRSVHGSFNYYQTHKKRVYDELLGWEQRERSRIVYENKNFIVFCPFVSKYPYEIRIFSKEGHAHFHQMPDNLDASFADAFRTSLQKLKSVLGSPPFNMFIHTAPLSEEFGINMHEFYHWHVEIIPHLKIGAGLEIGTGIEVNIVDPNEAAEELRKVKV